MVKKLPTMQDTWVQSLDWEDTLEKGTATHSSILAWEILRTEEPGRLQFMGSQSWMRLVAYRILVPRLGIKPAPPALESRVLTTEPPGKSPLPISLQHLTPLTTCFWEPSPLLAFRLVFPAGSLLFSAPSPPFLKASPKFLTLQALVLWPVSLRQLVPFSSFLEAFINI